MSQIYKNATSVTPPPGSVVTLQGNTGAVVPPNGSGNIFTVGTGSITVSGSPGTNTLTTQLTGITNHAVQIGAGTATLTQLVGTDNTALLGHTGSDPTFGQIPNGTLVNSSINVTSTGGSIIVTGSPVSLGGTVNVETSSSVNPPTAFSYTTVNHAMSPYSITSTDYYLACDTSGGTITLLFPNAPTFKRLFVVKDKSGTATVSNITITTVGGAVNIDGATSRTIASNYGSLQLLFNASTYEIY